MSTPLYSGQEGPNGQKKKSQGIMDFMRSIKLPKHFLVGLGVFLLVMIFVILSKKLYEKDTTPPEVLKKAASLVRKSADATFTAQQTNNPLLAMASMNDAASYLAIARELAKSDVELTEASKIPIKDLQDDVEREQKYAQDKILKLCPQVGSTGRVAAHAGFYANVPPLTAPRTSSSGSYSPLGGQAGHLANYKIPNNNYNNHQQQAPRPPVADGVYSGGHGMFTPL